MNINSHLGFLKSPLKMSKISAFSFMWMRPSWVNQLLNSCVFCKSWWPWIDWPQLFIPSCIPIFDTSSSWVTCISSTLGFGLALVNSTWAEVAISRFQGWALRDLPCFHLPSCTSAVTMSTTIPGEGWKTHGAESTSWVPVKFCQPGRLTGAWGYMTIALNHWALG